ncbi:MAG TPA: response regulator [Verrucomicrobiae bacterium]|nr:response regulator [Verrucomicrobiae bacterium]
MMITVLLVDDDDSLPLLLQHAIKRCGLPIKLHSVGDGEEAVEYLVHDGATEFPSLVLLDLKMPRMNGFEVLKWKQTQPHLEGLPVVVWSSSAMEEDKGRALHLGATSYFVKPMETSGFMELLKALEESVQSPGAIS